MGNHPAVACVSCVVLLASLGVPANAGPQEEPKDVPPVPFSFEKVVERASALAAQPYREPATALPQPLDQLDYDGYRDIRFRPEAALLHNDPSGFEVQLFHCGYLFRSPVQLHLVRPGEILDVPYRKEDFEFGARVDLTGVTLPSDLGFAGFRVHCPLNRPDYKDELLAFLGASYFRILGRGQVYGISARGLAIDTGESTGEEFPAFREFWIEQPDVGEIRIHALLDSKSVAGAYEFTVRPDESTSARVKVVLFARERIAKLGVAPLTSMFLFGEDRSRFFPDYRPEVHDSDVFLVANGVAGYSVRPLTNPRRVHHMSRFDGSELAGFGLLQRDRDFASYQDIESRFEARPSLWVTPIRGFEDGFVELVEIPSIEEIHDNVVAYFVPRKVLEAGERREFEYTLSVPSGDPPRDPALLVLESTRIHARKAGEMSLFVLDYISSASGDDAALPEAEARASDGAVTSVVVQRNPVSKGVRVTFEWRGESERVDLSVRLKREGSACAETWLYAYEVP